MNYTDVAVTTKSNMQKVFVSIDESLNCGHLYRQSIMRYSSYLAHPNIRESCSHSKGILGRTSIVKYEYDFTTIVANERARVLRAADDSKYKIARMELSAGIQAAAH